MAASKMRIAYRWSTNTNTNPNSRTITPAHRTTRHFRTIAARRSTLVSPSHRPQPRPSLLCRHQSSLKRVTKLRQRQAPSPNISVPRSQCFLGRSFHQLLILSNPAFPDEISVSFEQQKKRSEIKIFPHTLSSIVKTTNC